MVIKTMTIYSIAKTVLIVDVVLMLCLLIWTDKSTILNTQVSFVTFSMIVFVSYLSYKNKVKKSVANYDKNFMTDDNNKLELYDEEVDIKPTNNIKQTAKNIYDNLGRFISIYRIMSYAVFILGFFALKEQNVFKPVAYLVGISVLPVGIIVYIIKNIFTLKNNTNVQ